MAMPKALTPEAITALHARHMQGVSCRALAREAGIAHPTLTNHFHRLGLEVNNIKSKEDAIDPNISVYIRPSHAKWLSKIAKILNYDRGESSSGNSRVAREMLDWIKADENRLRQFVTDTLQVPLT